MRTRAAALKLLVPAMTLALVAAACGSKSSSKTTEAPPTTAATTEAPATTTAGTEAPATTAGGADGNTLPAACDAAATNLDEVHGAGASKYIADVLCAETKPLKAAGDPVVIGVQNPEGDPNGSFPEYSLATQAAADYINNELGGIGGDPSKGVAGRPIKIELCKMAITPADSQRCANELAGKKPYVVLSTLNFFGNHFPIYAQAGVIATRTSSRQEISTHVVHRK